MDNQQNHMLSEASKSVNTAENGSAGPIQEQQPPPEPVNTDGVAPQLQKWVYQTSQMDLTLAEILEKSKWEGECCKGGEKKN